MLGLVGVCVSWGGSVGSVSVVVAVFKVDFNNRRKLREFLLVFLSSSPSDFSCLSDLSCFSCLLGEDGTAWNGLLAVHSEYKVLKYSGSSSAS